MHDPFNETPVDPFLESAGNGLPACKFEHVGDMVSGVVTKIDKQIDTTVDGVPKKWDDGKPMHVFIFTLETANGPVNLYVRGNMVKAIREASGGVSTIGKRLTVKHHALGEKKPGKFAAKLFIAKVEPAMAPSARTQSMSAMDQAKMAAAGFNPQPVNDWPDGTPF